MKNLSKNDGAILGFGALLSIIIMLSYLSIAMKLIEYFSS